jgi:hypothetical protein
MSWMPQGYLIPHSQQQLSILMEPIHQQHNWDLDNTRQWLQAGYEERNILPHSVPSILHIYSKYVHCHDKKAYYNTKIQHILNIIYHGQACVCYWMHIHTSISAVSYSVKILFMLGSHLNENFPFILYKTTFKIIHIKWIHLRWEKNAYWK